MAKPNTYAGRCVTCGVALRPYEGLIVAEPAGRRPYRIYCVEHTTENRSEPPPPPEASKLRSIHLDDDSHQAVKWWRR